MATILTNKHDIPEVFFKACLIDKHVTRGDISTTQLIDAPQIRRLRAEHDIEEDVSDRIWMLFGTAVHHVLERAEIGHFQARHLMEAAEILNEGSEDEQKVAQWIIKKTKDKFPEVFQSKDLIENTMSIIVDGWEISGTIDKYDFERKTLQDYKVTGSWAYVYEEAKKKWYAQQNIYAYMLRQNGYEVNNAEIIAVFKDWSKFNGMRNKDYPKSPVMSIPVKLLPDEDILKYLKSRVRKHKASVAGDNIPCTAKERWATSEQWAVKKPNGKRAVRVLPTEELADAFIAENEGFSYSGLYKEFRPGEQKRCDSFCPVRELCPQKKAFDAAYNVEELKTK